MVGMSMRLTPMLAHRIVPQLGLRVTLEQHLAKEDFFRDLWHKAAESGNIKSYDRHGLAFDYAVVNAKDVPREITDNYGRAFAHCLYNGWDAFFFGAKYAMKRGQWMKFVVRGLHEMPPAYEQYAAVHEFGEEVTAGEHSKACILEWSIAKQENELRKYLKWIEKNSPANLMDIYNYSIYKETLPDEMLEIAEYASGDSRFDHVRELIDSYGMPIEAKRVVQRYARKGEEVDDLLGRFHESARRALGITGLGPKNAKFLARYLVQLASGEIALRSLSRYVNYPIVEARRDGIIKELGRSSESEYQNRLHVLGEILANPNAHQSDIEKAKTEMAQIEKPLLPGLPALRESLKLESVPPRPADAMLDHYFSHARRTIRSASGNALSDVDLFLPDYFVQRSVHELNRRNASLGARSGGFKKRLDAANKAFRKASGGDMISMSLMNGDLAALGDLHRRIAPDLRY